MKHILLIGAGFSRNWGGWLADEAFEYLLGAPEIAANKSLAPLLWKHHGHGGFEDALAQLQRAYMLNPQANRNDLIDLQGAVTRMFDDMNAGFRNSRFEFNSHVNHSVKKFLARFDAIFTLNQDLLLEQHYCGEMNTWSQRKWLGCELPGMQPQTAGTVGNANWSEIRWSPRPIDQYQTSSNCQPIYKLHGSSNWIATHGEPMIIVGGEKLRRIGTHPVLSKYFESFELLLGRPETKLMVIGYGFRDIHINDVLIRELNRDLKLFVIGPDGAGAAQACSPSHGGAISATSKLEDAFKAGLIGASRRGLREIFGNDSVEFPKVERFFG